MKAYIYGLFENDEEIDASKINFSKKENLEFAMKSLREMEVFE